MRSNTVRVAFALVLALASPSVAAETCRMWFGKPACGYQIHLSFEHATPGQTIVVDYLAPPTRSASDSIEVVHHQTHRVLERHRVESESGLFLFVAPFAPGQYQVRYLDGETRAVRAVQYLIVRDGAS